jgi:hypothetical protein
MEAMLQEPRLRIHTRERRYLVEDAAPVEALLRARGTPIEYIPGRPESRVFTVYLDTAAGTWSRGRSTTKFRCKNYDEAATWWFELKRRTGVVVDKWRRPATLDELRPVLDGTRRSDALARFVAVEPLVPLAVVTYRRTAFEWTGLRVTIDREVAFHAAEGMAQGRAVGVLRSSIVEVKCDGPVPSWLATGLAGRRAKEFSKSRRALALLRASS